MPSKPKAPAPPSRQIISRQLRQILIDSGQTAYALGRDANVDPGVIQRFLNEERDIRVETLDRLADILGLRLVEVGRGKTRPRSNRIESRSTTQRHASTPGENDDMMTSVDTSSEEVTS